MPLKPDTVCTGEQIKGKVQIFSEFIGTAGASGIISRHLTAPGQRKAVTFKSHHIIALPGVDTNFNSSRLSQSGFHINALSGIDLTGILEKFF